MHSFGKRLVLTILCALSLAFLICPGKTMAEEGSDENYVVTLTTVSQDGGGSVARVSGGGEYKKGSQATVIAYPRNKYTFLGWYDADDTDFTEQLSNSQDYTFTVNGDTDLVALYKKNSNASFTIEVHGSKFRVNNSSVQYDIYTQSFSAGEKMFVSFTDESMNFRYWADKSGNIISSDKNYSFVLSGNTVLDAYYTPINDNPNIGVVYFRNAYSQLFSSRTYSVTDEISFPTLIPIKMGCIFKGWYLADDTGMPSTVEATNDSIHSAMTVKNAIVIVPDYYESGEIFTLNIEYTDGEIQLADSGSEQVGIGQVKDVTAPSIQDYTFAYWMINDQIISYDKKVSVRRGTTDTVTLKAVYSKETVDKKALVEITQMFASRQESASANTYVLSTIMQYYVPNGSVISKSGFVYGVNGNLFGGEDASERLVLGGTDVYDKQSGLATLRGIFTYNLTTTNPERVLYIRGYVIYRDSKGELHTIYSDIRSGCYKSLSGETCKITFVGEGDAVLQSSDVPFGAKPVYAGEIPEKLADDKFTYTFAGWTPAIAFATEDAVYTAVFDAVSIPAPEPPTAEVTSAAAKENVQLTSIADMSPDTKTVRAVSALYAFLSEDPAADVAKYYDAWKSDFRVTFDRDIEAGSFGFYGAYSGYGNDYETAFLSPASFAQGESFFLLEAAGLSGVTYYDVHENIKEFICGVFNLNEVNLGTKIRVELVIWEDGTESSEGVVIASQDYTFDAVTVLDCIHSWRDWEVTKEPSCTNAGEETRVCVHCNETESREVEALGHDLVQHEAKAATCTEIGWNAYDACSRCDYTTKVEIPAKGHVPAPAVKENGLEPCCTDDGSYDLVVYCSVCNAELEREQITVPKYPSALITTKNPRENVILNDIGNGFAPLPKNIEKLSAEYLFTAVSPENATYEAYKDWYCDFRVVFADDFAKESFGLFGEYSGYGNEYSVSFLFPSDVSAGDRMYLLQSAGLGGVTYNDVLNNIGVFDCGIFNLDDVNNGKGITVDMVIWAPDESIETAYEIASVFYDFAEVTEINCIHDWSDWTIANNATCTATGLKERVCANCQQKETEEIPVLGHNLVQHEGKTATCTEIGWDVYDTCSRCDYTTYVETPALGHDLVHHEAKEATCTAIGWNEYDTCSRCDYTTYEEVPALGHDLVHHDAQEATCTEIGWDVYDTCSRCDYTTYEEIPARGHDLVHHEAKTATCTEIGWESYDTCSRCDYTTYEEIPALGHDLVHHNAQAATCTEIGWEAYDTCSRCDYTTYEEIPARGHDLIHHNAQEATCTEIGWDAYDTCLRCDYTTYEEIPARGHDLIHHNAQVATCTEIGWNAYDTCSRCDYTTYEEIPALGHDLVHHDAQEATCTEIGWDVYDTCSRCDYTTYEEIPALGHDWNAPTWFWDGTDSATATFICKHNSAHSETRVATGEMISSEIGSGENTGYMVYTAAVIFNDQQYSNTTFVQIVAANSFTHSDNLAHVDSYLYRVGNGNTVALGTLFKAVDSSISIDPANVKIKIVAVESNSSVKGTGSNLESGSTAKCVYSKNSNDWTASTLKFTGEGPVKVTIKDGKGEEYTLCLEVVNGKNVLSATNASNDNIILLCDVSTSGMSINNGKTLYGNGFSVIDTRVDTSGAKCWINISNGFADNVRFLGQYFPQAVTSGTSNQYYQTSVQLSGKSSMYNCLITGSKYAIDVATGSIILEGCTVIGGAIANIRISGGDSIVLDNLTTVQPGSSTSVSTPYGLGIIVESDVPKVVIEGYLKQYNWAKQNDIPSTFSSVFSDLYSSSKYFSIRYSEGNHTYVNTGILFFNENNNLIGKNLIDNRDEVYRISIPYESISKSFGGRTGVCYTAKGSAIDSALLAYNSSHIDNQHATAPTETYVWPNDQSSDRHFCTYDSAVNVIKIGYEAESNAGYVMNTDFLTVVKYGMELPYSVYINGIECINNSFTFKEVGTNTLEFRYYDPYNFDSNATLYDSVLYSKTIAVDVSAIAAAAKDAEFTFYGYNSISKNASATYSSKYVVTTSGKKYAMPDVSSANDYVKATTIDGITVYCPVVYVDFKDNSSDFNWLYPVFLGVDIKDYADGGTANNASYIVTHSNQSTKPTNLTIITTDKPTSGTGWSTGSGKSGSEGKFKSGTYKNLYGWTGGAIGSNNDGGWVYGQFSYKDNKGDTIYYCIAFYKAAHNLPSCFTAGTEITLSDGSTKPIEMISTADRILSWDFFTGEYVEQNIALLVDHGEDEYEVLNLEFSDGSVLKTVAEHGLFDYDLNQFVYIIPENYEYYIGHRFVKNSSNGDYDLIELKNADVTIEVTHAYSITAAYSSNAFASGILTVAPPEKFYNWIAMGEKLRYDITWFEAQLEQYGTYDYSVFKEYVTEDQFDQWNGKYLKIAVSSGKISLEEIIELINLYKKYMP